MIGTGEERGKQGKGEYILLGVILDNQGGWDSEMMMTFVFEAQRRMFYFCPVAVTYKGEDEG